MPPSVGASVVLADSAPSPHGHCAPPNPLWWRSMREDGVL